MAEKRTKKAKDLDPKAKGAEVKGGRKNVLSDGQRSLVQRLVNRVTGTGDEGSVLNPKN